MLLSTVKDEFVFHCQSRNLSPKTTKNYRKQIEYLLNYLAAEYQVTHIEDVKPEHIKTFLVKMKVSHKVNYIKLVHPKSKPHTIENRSFNYKKPEDSYSDYVQAFNEEIGFIYNNLEAEMLVYDDLKKNLACCNKGVEVIGFLRDDLEKEIGKVIADSIRTAYNKL